MDKKIEKILDEITDFLYDKEEHNEDIDNAKKSITADLERRPKALLYASPTGTLFAGQLNHLLALISLIFDNLSEDEDVTTEMLTVAFMTGMTKGRNTKKAKEITNDILEAMKQMI